jgi:hypothetical protein
MRKESVSAAIRRLLTTGLSMEESTNEPS